MRLARARRVVCVVYVCGWGKQALFLSLVFLFENKTKTYTLANLKQRTNGGPLVSARRSWCTEIVPFFRLRVVLNHLREVPREQNQRHRYRCQYPGDACAAANRAHLLRVRLAVRP